MESASKAQILSRLQSDILRFQGFKPADHLDHSAWLGAINQSFPNATFPTGAVHEFIAPGMEEMAATSGFVSAVASHLMKSHGVAMWISQRQWMFPPSFKSFGLDPDRILFVKTSKEKESLWVMEEALKCGALTVVVSELCDLTFTASRRLQLAVEQSRVTGFVLRHRYKKLSTNACVSRWQVSSLPTDSIDDLPGIGFPKWKVELLRIRNGYPNTWNVQWNNGEFNISSRQTEPISIETEAQIKFG
ncbi:MAG: Error-prone repair protein ImuA [Cyclobacteriaceae bacterium]|nr:Error-prone repair protein ImuA [Cyclobacteriaceae bacterium]